jgi:hypothetical protein
VPVTVGPVAAAGPDQNAVTGQPVTLNGSASFDPDGDTLAFSWRFVSVPSVPVASAANIVNPTSPAPSFTPDVDGAYELELRVTDGTLSNTDRVVITAAAPGRVPPNANAGLDQNADVGQQVNLNGSGSNDPDNGPSPLTFQWTFAPVALGSTLTNANITNATSAQASFTPDVVYLLRLDVFDGQSTDDDQVMVTVAATTPTTTTTLPTPTTTTLPPTTTTTLPPTTTRAVQLKRVAVSYQAT